MRNSIKIMKPKGWCRYKSETQDFCYNPLEYEIILGEDGRHFCHYHAKGDTPSQPIGLLDFYQLFAKYEGDTLHLESWDTSQVYSFYRCFAFCCNLKELCITGWKFDNAESMREMFYRCSSLEKFVLEGVDAPKLESIDSMWSGCFKLQRLFLNNWKVPKLKNMTSFCNDCMSLERVEYNDWVVENSVNNFGIFNNCFNLKLDD